MSYLLQSQYQQIIYDWNRTDKEYSNNKTIHQLFEEQVSKTPDNIAVIYQETKLTYKELNEKANQLANYLKQVHDIKPDTLIALCLDRNEHMLIAILAVLKAGGAYVPIDPSYPDDRIHYILTDTNTKLALTNEVYGKKLSQVNALNIITLDNEILQQQLSLQSAANLKTAMSSTDLIYVIYTSGTTGNPKGVMIEHRSIVNRIQWMNNVYNLNRSDKILQKTPYVFDVSVWELLWANCYGGCVVFAEPNGHKDIQYIIDLIAKESITIVHFVPSMLNALLETVESEGISSDIISKLRYVFCSGEALSLKQVQKFQKLLPKIAIHNLYGPTEASVDVLSYDCNNQNIQTVLIGKAIQNTTLYVLDDSLNPIPIGAVGELYVGGIGLARGYLNKPELTAEKFIANPFQTEEEEIQNNNARLYKTGDLVRWLSDGNLEYIGRNDFQVKIRGYRIELGEIENVISSYDGIKQSVVIAKEHKNTEEDLASHKYLVGYYVSEPKLAEEDIISYLQEKLPEYMIPSVLMHLKELPLTINGKLNRKALPEPEFSNIENYVAPRNELEKQVCKIWANVLDLTVNKVGIRDDFFRLGGDSIIAIRLVSQLNKKLNNDIPLSSIFKYRTIQKLVHYFTHNTEDKVIINKSTITNKEEQLLSFAQERLWFIEKYEEGTNAYNIPMIFKLSNNVKLDILARSIKSIVTRHEILRTLIKEDSEGNGYQVIINEQEYPFKVLKINVTSYPQLDQALEKQVNHIYDLTKEYPIRVYLYVLDCDTQVKDSSKIIECYLSIVVHHIAFDEWSADIFLRELQKYYHYHLNLSQGLVANLNLPSLNIQYKNFALWQRNYLSGKKLAKQLEYWKNKLEDYIPLNLISDKQRPKQIDYRGSDIYFKLDKDISERLRELAKRLKVSLYSLLLSGYYLMLRSYSNQDDITIGIPITNRHYNQVENVIGFFVNSLILRTKIDSNALVKEFIQRVGDEVVTAQLYQDLPFEKLVEELQVVKDTSRHPIFQVMFAAHNSKFYNKTKNNLTNLLQKYKTENTLYKVARFDISTFIDDSEVILKGSFNYAVNLYTEATINRFVETYIQILKQLAGITYDKKRQDTIRIAELNYLNLEQYQQIIHDWNNTDKNYPNNKTIHQLFEEQVDKTPDNIAVIYKETKLTYKELNEKANQLANYLKQIHDIKSDTLVALCLDRSEHMLIAILAVLKAGGTYVPIDPSYPDDRIHYILTDANTKLALTNEVYGKKLSQVNALNIITLDNEILQQQLSLQSAANLKTAMSSTDLIYVIYTSGTTGNPKGVMIEHRSIVNRIQWMNNVYNLNRSDKILQKTPYVFDVSVWELLWANCYGGCVVFAEPNGHKDIQYIIDLIAKESITIVHFVPSMLNALLETVESEGISSDIISKLRYVFCSGEALSLKQVQKFQKLLPKIAIHNLYGPTEASVDVLSYDCNNQNIQTVLIGKAIQNTTLYVLDDSLNPIPIGAVGELYVGGIGLARGYLNKPELTAEKFIANPFQTEEEEIQNNNARLYKTGDLVRWLSDGNLEYIGRNDFQVKIRGYRIELGEIENVISSYDGIKQSVVIAKEHKNTEEDLASHKYLVGYYVSEPKLAEEDIISYLQEKLPEYMIPSVLMHLTELPLTVNGKLDRKALPDPEFISSDNCLAPRNKLEKQVRDIWANVLGLATDKVGIRDDFFRLGGDSIVSIQLISKLHQKLNLNVSIKDIFVYKTIERLYDNVLSHNNTILNIKTEQGLLKGKVELLPIQLWFFKNNFAKANHWNQSFIIRTPSLDLERLEKSVHKLVEHHDNFRLRYSKVKNHLSLKQTNTSLAYTQYYDDNIKVEELKTLDIETLKEKEGSEQFQTKLQEVLTNWQSDFNLEYGPLYRIGYIYGYSDGSTRIFFALHHLIVDAVSWRILVEDLRNIYNGKELAPKGSSYRQWVETVKEYANTHFEERNYWHNVLADYDANVVAKLVVSENICNYANFELGIEQTKQLLRDSNKAYHTQVNDLLLTALGYALYQITKNFVNHIMLEGHGREEIDNNIDIIRTIGWFTTMYPVRLEVYEELGDSIKNTKENLRQIPNKGIGYGTIIGYKLKNIPKIIFNYLGQFDEESSLEQQNFWSIVDENSGVSTHNDNHDYNIISINIWVIDGRLKCTVISKLSEDILTKLAKLFRQKLEDIINHTVKQTRSYLTISDVENIISKEYLNKLQKIREIDGIYLANSLQQGFIYHALNQGNDDDAYIVQLIWKYENKIEVNNLKEAWYYAQIKYQSLRLRFGWEEELIQVIDKVGNLDWRYIDLSSGIKAKDQEQEIKKIQEQDRVETYSLDNGNLFRVYLIKQKEELYTCIFSNHHAILDGWSTPILLGYIHGTYLQLQNKEAVSVSINYSYEDVQKYLWRHKDANNVYWDNYVSKIEERDDLSYLLSSTNKHIILNEYKHIKESKELELNIQDKLYYDLKKLSQREGITLNTILQYVWHKVLSIYGRNNQTIVGTTVSGRDIPINNIENSVGLYINTLPLIVDHSKQSKIIELLKVIQNDINEINSRSNINLAKLQKRGERLFNNLFIYENYPSASNTEQQDKILRVKFEESKEKLDYPLGVIAYEANNQVILKLKYAGELFYDDSIKNLLLTLKRLLEQIANNFQLKVQYLSYLPEGQHQQIIYDWNQTNKEYSNNKTIHQLFEEQVGKTPDNIAVIYQETKLTYKELNEKANQLANYLKQVHDIKPDTLIALCLDRNEHMLIAILAVLKAGGAYVPIDPSYPDDRIHYILTDANTKLALTNEVYGKKLSQVNALNIITLDNEILQQQLSLQSAANLKTAMSSTDLIYVIYTSGTTGNPKGVMIEHRSIVNRIQWMNNVYNLNRSDKILQKTPYVFDVSVWELLWANCYGGCVVFAEPNGHKDIQYIIDLIAKESITIVHFVPSMLNALLETVESEGISSDIISKLRYVFCSGEALSLKQVQKFQKLLPKIAIHNLYGPTEASVDVLSYDCNNQNIQTVLIGKAIQNTTLYVLDDSLNPIPIGAVGELYVGGIGLARGYLNKPELTAEKFIANPFQTEEEKIQNNNARLYKTGDLVRWLSDGNLEYIGRNDFQVKIRGYRIELGEIENVISSYDGIKQSVVIAKEHKNTEEDLASHKYLVGYYVSEPKLAEEDIISYLQEKLPEYMIPSVLMHLKKLPLTINGKLNRKALPEPEFSNIENYVAPRNELEKQICEIWADLLGIDKVGIRDDFFRLGGNSIIAIRLVSQLNKKLSINTALSSIFKYRIIQELANYLKHSTEDKVIINKAIINNVEEQLLSFAQKRLWFIEKYEEGTNAYNVPMVFKLPNDIKLDLLKRSIKSIVTRHEILRTLIKEDREGSSYQVVTNDQEYPLEIANISITSRLQLDQKLEKQINCIFDLTNEYPIKIYLCVLDNNVQINNFSKTVEYYLSIVIHHIAFDGWSMDIFLKELRIYYDYYLKQSQGLRPKLDLPELSIQYKDFALWQRSYLSGQKLNEQLDYWKEKLNGYETLNLITDNLRPNKVDYKGQNIDFELDKSTSISLRELAKELKVSLYSILLSGYYLLLRCYSNQDDIVVGTPVANRHYNQIENLIGFFVNSLVLRTKINSSSSVKEFIQEVGNEIIEAQLHQDLPFEKLVEELKIPKDTSRHPIFQVWFITQSFGNEIYKKQSDSIINLTNLLQSYVTDSFYKASKFDIALFINDGELILKGTFNYALSLYNEKTINGFIGTYIQILKQLARTSYDKQKQEKIKVAELSYLNLEQYQQIIYDWNHTDKEYSRDKSIHQLFEEQVGKTPDNIAVIYKETKLTYKELNEKANQLANYLKQVHYIKPDTLVALCLDRSEHMLIAILAVLKAGGAYVPIDPSYPDDRIHYILTDTNTKLALTNEVYGKKLSQVNALNIITLDNEILQQQLSLQSAANLKTAMSSTDLIYVIYTSGTTGNPKGVMIEHRSIVNRIQWMNNVYNLNRSDKILQKTPYVFDVSVWELLWANCYGGCVVFAEPNGHKDIQYIIDLIAKESITIVHFVPSMLNALLETVESEGISSDIISKLRYVFCSGEALSLKQVQKFQKLLPKVAIHNLYGPTEASVDVLSYDCNNQNIQAVLIGKAIQNTTLCVLDDSLNPVPIGAVGELYIGGIGLARGYLNKPELTAEKFIANPFQTEEEEIQNNNARLYKTGDLVRWLSDGNLEYIGRNDFQVKIRGYRIELGEIENVISSYDGIKQSVVVVKESVTNIDSLTDNKYLVGYYVRNIELNNEDRENFIATWEEVYQSQYVSLNINNFKQNTISWNSSYTGEAIPQKEMVEWVNSTIERIKSLNPKVILEIGSGTGLILFNIIDSCNYYYATDLSQNAVDYINTVINKFGYSNKITALICSASDITYNKLEKSYDTVIMNSIVQYFPNLDYLESVITEAILNIKDQGQIFIGDIRDYRLLKCFHYSVQSYKNQQVTKAEIDYFVKREKELLVSPEYFIYLRTVIDAISHVEIMPKIGQANNEMNKYRYDVILYVNKNQEAVKNGICVSASEFINVLNFEEHLDQENDYLCIKYPNKRIIEDYIGYNALDKEKIITLDNDNILSISEIIEKVKNSNYKAKFLVDVNDPLYLNIILYTSEKNIYLDYSPSGKLLKSNLANNPLMSYKLLENEFSTALKDYLNTRLPEYMVPGSLVHLESLPLTINGKLDKKALPDPEFTSSDNYVAPRTELEKQVCEIWANLLGLAIGKVGINDDFFRLGGDSIVSIQLVSRLRQKLNLNVSIKDIFVYKTIERLYDNVLSHNNTILNIKTEQGLLKGKVELLPIQLWFFKNNFAKANHWNQSFIIRTPSLDLERLEKSVHKLVEHHDNFRLRYSKVKNHLSLKQTNTSLAYTQYYDDNIKVEELKTLDIETLKEKEGSEQFQTKLQEVLTNWQSDFNLEYGPLYRIGYIYGYSDGSTRIFFALHHLIVDAVSWRILVEDLRNIYNGKELAPKGSSYRQWVETIKEYANTHFEERNYWHNVLADYDANVVAKLVVSENICNYANFELGIEQTKQLLRDSNKAYHTQVNDLLLTALGYALYQITKNFVNHIMLEGHGREEIDNNIDVTRTVGWFTTMYPVRLEVYEELDDSIKNTKENLRQIPNKGIGYGIIMGHHLKNIPKIIFNYLGQFDEESSIEQQNSWSIVDENSGVSTHSDNQDYNIISINIWVIDGRLKCTVISKLSEDILTKLIKLFRQKLEDIINHAVKQNRGYLTISDINQW